MKSQIAPKIPPYNTKKAVSAHFRHLVKWDIIELGLFHIKLGSPTSMVVKIGFDWVRFS
jgi:hypothetical protein